MKPKISYEESKKNKTLNEFIKKHEFKQTTESK